MVHPVTGMAIYTRFEKILSEREGSYTESQYVYSEGEEEESVELYDAEDSDEDTGHLCGST